jgi:alpha-glucosidase
MAESHWWWQRGIVYQIYPRSFMDATSDGVGDLPGIEARLDYLEWLGVDALWISPIYPSPMADFGYDVSDHCDIDPRFGTLADFDRLIASAHARGLKLILDYVPNHTSSEHPWFVEARSSRHNDKRDFYIWHDALRDGSPPNNWLSEFGGSAWEWDELTQQYYYHAYLKEQPDLNWRNPRVREAMYDVLRFWLERGVDGFRIDTIHHLIKDDQFRDNPPNPDFRPGMPPHRRVVRTYTTDRPEVHEAVAEMRRLVDEYRDRVLIGEAWLPLDRLVAYYGTDLSGLHLPFNFQLIGAEWDASAIAGIARAYEAALPQGGWPNWVLGNHDRSRIATRVGLEQARVAAMLLLTLRGTPTMYYGDELGMEDVEIPPELVQDPWEKNVPGLGLGRDPVRTPMPWSSEENGGFSVHTPWLPLARNYPEVNVAVERADRTSLLNLYRALIDLRRRETALQIGAFIPLEIGPDVFAYMREHDGRHLAVLLNLTAVPRKPMLPSTLEFERILLSTHLDRDGSFATTEELRANEGLIVEVLPK